MRLRENLLKISTRTAIGDAGDECAVDGDGGGLEIGFNNKYLMDALKRRRPTRSVWSSPTGVSPVSFCRTTTVRTSSIWCCPCG